MRSRNDIMSTLTDKELISKAKEGDEDSWTELYNRYKASVTGLVIKWGGSQDNEDISQQIWMLVFERLKQFKFESEFCTWIGRIAINQTLMNHRYMVNGKRDLKSSTSIDDPLCKVYANQASYRDKNLQSVVDRLSLQKILHSLPDTKSKRTLIDHYFNDMSFNDLKKKYKISLNAAKSRVHKPLMELRKRFR